MMGGGVPELIIVSCQLPALQASDLIRQSNSLTYMTFPGLK